MYEGLLDDKRTTMREEISRVGSLALDAVIDEVVMIRDGWIQIQKKSVILRQPTAS